VRRGANRQETPSPARFARGLTAGRLALATHPSKPNAVRRGANRQQTPHPARFARGLTAGRLALATHPSKPNAVRRGANRHRLPRPTWDSPRPYGLRLALATHPSKPNAVRRGANRHRPPRPTWDSPRPYGLRLVRQGGSARGCPCPGSRRCWPSEARMAKRGQHRASGGQDARSKRPATGHGNPERRSGASVPPSLTRLGFLSSERTSGDGAWAPRAATSSGRRFFRTLVFAAACGMVEGYAPLAQLDRASVYGTEGCWFEPSGVYFRSTATVLPVASTARLPMATVARPAVPGTAPLASLVHPPAKLGYRE
jgi:hypothetical protein